MSLSILRVSSHVKVATVEEISVNVTSVESALKCKMGLYTKGR